MRNRLDSSKNDMHMKKYILTFSILLLATTGYAQKFNIKGANKLFAKRAYVDAAEQFVQSKVIDMQTLQRIGDCYYFNTKMKDAAKWYSRLFKSYGNNTDPAYMFRYAQALKGIEEYEQADEWMDKYKQAISEETADGEGTLTYMAKVDSDVPYLYTPEKIAANSENSDFGVAFYGDKVVFAAASDSVSSKTYKWNKEPYLDLFIGTPDDEGNINNVTLFSDEINTATHEATPVFTKDGNTMYFCRTNEKKVKLPHEKVANIKLYKAEKVDGKWTNITELPFNSDAHSCGHPSLSPDEKKLFFISDMPGTIGMMDIFEVDILEDGTYGEPRNLGNKINTPKREMFPYMSEYNTLYFASDGHLGLGNLDVFSSQIEESEYSTPKNLGSSVNTGLDDFAFVINEATDKGFLSSNRSGSASDDIYYFKRKEFIKPVYIVEGVVSDKNSGELLPGSLVTLMDEDNNVIADTIVKDDARYQFKLDPNKKYVVRGTRKLYDPYDVNFSTDSEGKISHNIYLKLELYSDKEDNIIATTDGSTQVKINKIYFDFDKWNIRPDAAKELDVLVGVMKKYPDMEIEVSAHTDCRGSSDYNLSLSHKRAKSTLDYLVSQGIAKSRLKSIGYGEMQPLNKCVREGICKEEEYDVNRRCEFKLLK